METVHTEGGQVKHLLFDADGVLFFHSDKMFSDRLIEEYDAPADSVKSFFADIFPDCIVNKRDLKQELVKQLDGWHWPGSVYELMEYWYSYEHNVDKPLINYVRSLGRQGIGASVATNNDHYRAAWLFNCLQLDGTVFDALYAAGDMGVAKPDDIYFQMVMTDLSPLTPDEVLFWDDTPKNIDAARAYGLNAELYTTFADFQDKMVQYV